MASSRQQLLPAHQAGHVPGPGAIVRNARMAQGLSLAQFGARIGYSASQLSRYERGIAPLTDITMLRRFADALGLPPEVFGLSPPDGRGTTRHAVFTEHRPRTARGNNVDPERPCEDGDDPVRRRDMLTGTAALASSTLAGVPRQSRQATLQDVLYARPATTPIPLPDLRAAITAARSDFQAARYDRVTSALPRLIAVAQATSNASDTSRHAGAATILAQAYTLAADFAVKVNDDPVSWMTADRALQAALAGNDPLVLANARRAVATALRRAGHPGRACALLVRACEDLQSADPDTKAMYGTLLNVAAYTAATGGDRNAANEFITEAAAAAARLGTPGSSRLPAFTPVGVTLYQVSIAQVLGDNGTAIDHARRLRTADIPTPERRGRYWVDVARAYHQWGKARPCYTALLAAERAAPAEVRFRPPVHRMTQDLLASPAGNTLPGLRDFARRSGLAV